ncbi:MAG TPA: apolipoprotein N-acyltransferase [Acidimicrobiia bacterium]|nr:apolipoprotein N-acyltransferase [Acidimicrobiia bacterium]
MIGGLLVLAGAALSALAFPRIGPGWLILPGIALFLAGLRMAGSRAQGLLYGALYGLTFFSGLIWWLSELGLIAVLPLVIEQAAFFGAYGWWLARYNDRSSGTWFLLTVGGWALMELIRYRFPVGGFEWGAAGYALSDQVWARDLAPSFGTTGVTVMTVMAAAGMVSLLLKPRNWWVLVPVPLFVVASLLLEWFEPVDYVLEGQRVAIVQGSTPCPFVHCPPDERLRTFEQHLELTKQIAPASVFLVVWSEGSTGSFNADPVQNPEIGAAIAAEARRIGAWFLVGSDRPISETHWINANVVFNPEGEIVGEYQKQHAVPFGEYIPWRPLFEWIPDLDQVPRDMIPGDGPVVFDLDEGIRLGSVISFEGGFARYPRQHVVAGANLIVVATNEGSYGITPGSDQFIGMTRMRAAELGLDVIHAAVTGKSTVISADGSLQDVSGLGTQEIIYGAVAGRPDASLYARTSDVLMIAAALIGLLTWWRARRPLVVSAPAIDEEE